MTTNTQAEGAAKSSARPILYIGTHPTPYTNLFLTAIAQRYAGGMEVVFAADGIQDEQFPPPPGLNARFYKKPWGLDIRTIRNAASRRNALVISFGWSDPTRACALSLMAILRRPYALWTDTPPNRPGPRHAIRNIIVRFWARHARAVLGTGRPALDAYESIGVAPRKLVNFPCWVPTGDAAPNNHGTPGPGPIRLCCVGRLVPLKGFDLAIRALADLGSEATLDIIGSGPQRAPLEQLAANLGVTGRTRFLGNLPNDAVLWHMRNCADVFLQPNSSREAYGVTLLEAMASGLPVITTAHCMAGIDRIKSGANGILLPATAKPRELAEAISRLTRPAERQRMGEAARATANEWPVTRGVEIVLKLAADQKTALPRGKEC